MPQTITVRGRARDPRHLETVARVNELTGAQVQEFIEHDDGSVGIVVSAKTLSPAQVEAVQDLVLASTAAEAKLMRQALAALEANGAYLAKTPAVTAQDKQLRALTAQMNVLIRLLTEAPDPGAPPAPSPGKAAEAASRT